MNDQLHRPATSLTSDMFINRATRRWVDAHRRTGGSPIYYYAFTHKRRSGAGRLPEDSAVHSGEIRYALRTLGRPTQLIWPLKERLLSWLFSSYLAQFVKTGTPNEVPQSNWLPTREEGGGLLRQEIGEKLGTIVDIDAP